MKSVLVICCGNCRYRFVLIVPRLEPMERESVECPSCHAAAPVLQQIDMPVYLAEAVS